MLTTTARLNRNSRFLDWYLMPEAYSATLVSEMISELGVPSGGTVLDPFCGTGTTLVAAKLAGYNALGIEVNPFLCFASRVKSRTEFDLPLLTLEVERLMANAPCALDRAEAGKSPLVEQTLPDMPRLDRWITRRVALKVLALRACIEEHLSEQNRDVPMLALASILRAVSNMKLSPHAFGSREVKQDAPVMAMFQAKLLKMLDDIRWLGEQTETGRVEVIQGDIRQASGLEHPFLPVDLAITSPPYLNNLDYTMQTRLELFFLGFIKSMEELKGLRKRMMICDAKATYKDIQDWHRVEDVLSIEAAAAAIDTKLSDKGWGWDYGRMTRQYFGGLLRSLEAIKPMLAPGASLVLILGESAHAGVLVPVPEIACELGRIAGYTHAEVKTMRTRRSPSHSFSLKESAVILS